MKFIVEVDDSTVATFYDSPQDAADDMAEAIGAECGFEGEFTVTPEPSA